MRLQTYGILLLLALAACQQTPPMPGQKLGKPYAVGGKFYYPEYDANYDKTGMASWYGPGFHGKYTANGEIFNENDLTAAHPTLPMPSLVRVTNLKNGESIVVRINDRGPFVKSRIIDLSKKSAQMIGLLSTMPVRVQFLPKETQAYLDSVERGHPLDMFAYNKKLEDEQSEETVASDEQKEQASPDNTDQPEQAADNTESTAVESVSSDDLVPAKPARHIHLIKDAQADENAAPSAPDDTTLSKGTFIIQAGAFSARVNAEKLGNKLSNIAHAAIDHITVSGKTLWRVRLGPFDAQQDAQEALNHVRAAGQQDAKIVRL